MRSSVTATLMKDAIDDAGINAQDPGEVEQFYLHDEQLLVFDLGGSYQDNQDNE